MGWLDAHESYVMEIIARDREDELRSTVEITTAHIGPTTPPAPPLPETRHKATGAMALCPHALAKPSR